ncbi:3-carboxymuconate cyclase [Brachybacterium endophyticum]|uniref:3-carboxymuconate cyclase n=1 Tax=Brachybacterium endophyticum TaxID=2182385 RepID=A0A2U2RPH2_9MICO|nr:beta-propeller fold lactonase family protein [Brachybacterium endophyticum]PWH07767.1 3-carboxymuconate cyclase [Brachybacterium endophyticum]
MTPTLIATGCYSSAGSGRGRGIELLEWSPEQGARVLATVDLPDPSFVIWSADGTLLHAVLETSPTRVVTLRPGADAASLEVIADITLRGEGGCHLALGPDGRTLIVAEFGSGTVETILLDEDGVPAELIDLDDHHDFAEGRTPHPHQSVLLPESDLIAITDLGLDRVLLYRQDRLDGHIDLAAELALPTGSGPRHLAADHESSELHISCELSGKVATAMRKPPGTGERSFVGDGSSIESTWDVTSNVAASGIEGENAVSHLELSADEHHLLVANRGPNTLSVLDRGQQAPQLLAEIGVGAHPRHFTQTQGHILVAAQEADRIDVLRLDGGDLEVAAEPIPSASVSCLAPRP